MRACAQINEFTLTVERDILALACVFFNQLHLVGLLLLLHQLFCFGRGKKEPLDRQVLFDDLFHLRLNFRQILGGQGAGQIKVIIKAALDRRADGEFRFGEQAFHGLCHNVRGGVPVGLLALLLLKGQDFDGTVLAERSAQINDLAVYTPGTGSLVKARAKGFRHFRNGNPGFIFSDIVFQCYFNHGASS